MSNVNLNQERAMLNKTKTNYAKATAVAVVGISASMIAPITIPTIIGLTFVGLGTCCFSKFKMNQIDEKLKELNTDIPQSNK